MAIGTLERIYVDRMVDYLSVEGRRIIEKAMRTKDPDIAIDTGNQMDSYGYAIWYKGTLVKKETGDPEYGKYAEEPHKGWPRYGVPSGYGSDWADMFIKEFTSTHSFPKDRFCLVVFNAAFYSKIQEEGGGALRRSYRIISQIIGDLDNVGKRFDAPPSKTFGL